MAVLPTGIGPVTGYNIERSLRFNSADSAYLNRTPASASNRKTWTWSGWVKRGILNSSAGAAYPLFAVPTGTTDSTWFELRFVSDFLYIAGYSTNWRITSQVFRDPSAWYHIVLSVDTTQATANDRLKLYVNGTQVTTFSTTNNPTQNADLGVNQAAATYIGFSNTQYFNGYMTEINFIDGQALTPSSFGETDTNTGVWKPKAYTGTYGTNGFFLKFADNSNTTAATLGKDSSGNGNNWTPNNFSVTAGAGNDSMVDSPTSYGTDTGVGGEVRGNYCTLNPLNKPTNIVLANGNLQATNSVGAIENVRSTMPTASTYSYWEVTASVVGSSLRMDLGGILSSYVQSISNTSYLAGGASTGTFGANWDSAFRFYINGSNVYSSGTANLVANDVVMFAHDSSTGKIWVGLNGTWYNSGNPAAGTGNLGTLNAETVFPAVMINGNVGANGVYTNFGQRPFAYTTPSGFKALCTANLPSVAITNPRKHFDVKTHSGNGGSQSITGLQFSPDFWWVKSRNLSASHCLFDRIRGANASLFSELTLAENTSWTGQSFNSDGVTADATYSYQTNGTGYTFVDWLWKANGAGSSNTAGTITSTVSANTTSGFSIVTYTGNGTGGATVGHGLGVTPFMYIVKRRNSTGNWNTYHVSIGPTKGLDMDLTNAATTSSAYWNNTSPTSTVFSLGTGLGVNGSGGTFVAYCFAEVAGYSAFGSYTGNGSTDGPFVYTGFRPKYLLLKLTNTTGSWQVKDSARNTYNVTNLTLYPNLSNAEASDIQVDFLSNGFKLRSSTGENANGNTVIYAAFAESPFKYSLAR